jgi:hypothetical protein
LQQSFSFLGVANDFAPHDVTDRVNQSQAPRSRLLVAAMHGARRFIQAVTTPPLLQRLVWNLKLYRLQQWLVQKNLRPFTPPPPSATMRRQLLDYYRSDIEALGAFLGRDLSHWLS